MRNKKLLIVGAVLSLMALSTGVWAADVPKDIVLVLDNSGSMRKNDPKFLAKKAVTDFINGLEDDTDAAVIIFDQKVDLAVPLTPVTDKTKAKFLASLKDINYRGQFTDSPAAMERAIYELKTNGRQGAEKSIIFMTDGIVDTGNAARDLDKSKWLRQDLAADAAQSGIRIFAIAFTENADFQLIQSLAQKTHGEYFRALTAEDLGGVYKRIKAILEKPPAPAVAPAPAPSPESAAGPTVTPTGPATGAAPQEKPLPAEEMPAGQSSGEPGAAKPAPAPAPPEESAPPAPAPAVPATPPQQAQPPQQSEPAIEEPAPAGMPLWQLLLIIGAGGTVLIVAAVVVLMRRRGQPPVQEDETEYVPQAFFKDIHGITGQDSYPLGAKPTMLGRVAGQDADHLDYIVIKESTVGRRHALIEYKDYSYWIIDQGSVNGTFVNGEKVTAERRLKHGDRIKLHNYEFEFVMPEMADSGRTVFSSPGDATVVSPQASAAAAAGVAGLEEALQAPHEESAGEAPSEEVSEQEEESAAAEQPAAALLGESWDIDIGGEDAEAAADEAEKVDLADETEGGAGELEDAAQEEGVAPEPQGDDDEEATMLRAHSVQPEPVEASGPSVEAQAPEEGERGQPEAGEAQFAEEEEGLDELDSLFESATFDSPKGQPSPADEAPDAGEQPCSPERDAEGAAVSPERETPAPGDISLDAFIETSAFEVEDKGGGTPDDRTVILDQTEAGLAARDIRLDEQASADETVLPSTAAGDQEDSGEGDISLDDFIATSMWENPESMSEEPSSNQTDEAPEGPEEPLDETVGPDDEGTAAAPAPRNKGEADSADKTMALSGQEAQPDAEEGQVEGDSDKTVLFTDEEDDARTILPSKVKDEDTGSDEEEEEEDHFGDTTVFNAGDFNDPSKGGKR